jgi:carotenoid 1,2-hydratase
MCAVAEDARPRRPIFDVPVPAGGYRWWYADGISPDGSAGFVVIAFVGSVFSPYYFNARQRGAGDPENYVAFNVGLYGPRRDLWAMTERSRRALSRDVDSFRVGPSRMTWRDGRLDIHICERSAPLARRIRGRISIVPDFLNAREFELDSGGRHRWQPIAPSARVEVRMESPQLSWHGHGYLDTNAGQRALEDDFKCWNWSRGENSGATVITYAVTEVDGRERALALEFGRSGTLAEIEVPAEFRLPRTGWRIARPCRAHARPSLLRTLEDTPFYSRSLLADHLQGSVALTMHESLDLKRFKSRWVRTLLPFRMPRIR